LVPFLPHNNSYFAKIRYQQFFYHEASYKNFRRLTLWRLTTYISVVPHS